MKNQIIHCPNCASENVVFSKKRSVHLCEDCQHEFVPGKPVIPMRIFLSYGHDSNEELVRRIRADLETRGHDVWFDQSEIKTGHDWRRSITEGIVDSHRVLSFLSKYSTRDPGVCLDEIAIAIGVKGGNIQTILVESEQEVKPPPSISHIQWLDMHDWKEQRDAGEAAWDKWYQEKFAEIVTVVESDESRRFAGEIKTLEEHLKPISSDSRIFQLLKKGLVGRAWLVEAIEQWRNADRASRLFWIMGAPGVGKSAFAAHLAHYGRDKVIAVQFCEYDKPDHRSAHRIVRTLAFQIATRLPDYRKLLLTLPEITKLNRKNPADLFDYLLADPLRHAIDGGRERYLIVIDALDEAGGNGRNELVEMLARNAPRLPDWIGIVVTSRPESDVIAPLQGLNPFVLDTATESNRADIRDFLRRELASHLQNRPDADRLVEQILEKSEGVFLYVERFCDDVQRGYLSLDRPEQFPQGLGGIFFQYFQRQFPNLEKFRKDVRPALRAILAAREPLPMEILQRLFNWQDEELRDFTRPLASLFPATTEASHEVIKPYHKSLADWLTDDGKAGPYFVSVMEGHRMLADYGWIEYQRGFEVVSQFISSSLPRHLAASSRWPELQCILTDTRVPLRPAWIEVNNFPDTWDFSPITARLSAIHEGAWERYRYGRPDDLEDFELVFGLFAQIASKRTAKWFFETISSNERLPGFFESGFSDICCGLHVNLAKVRVYRSVKDTIRRLAEIGVAIPNQVTLFRERLKTSCLYCDGQYLFNEPDLINELANNRSSVFRGDWDSHDKLFNTFSLVIEATSKDGDVSLAEKLIDLGANVTHKFFGKALPDCARENGNQALADLLARSRSQ
jgi:hypothetical protein